MERTSLDELLGIYGTIEQRTRAITTKRPDWLCHKGCDQCCRELAQLPELTAAEWAYIQQGLAELDPVVQDEVAARIQALAQVAQGPITCPLLDDATGTCLVYAQRPAMCRMYGFYASGVDNLWCNMIQARYEAGAYDEVVLGNHSMIDRALQLYGGETQSLVLWFEGRCSDRDDNDD